MDARREASKSKQTNKSTPGGFQMSKATNRILGLIRRSDRAQTMTEYVLIIAAIAVAGYAAYQGLEGGIEGIITSVTATLAAA